MGEELSKKVSDPKIIFYLRTNISFTDKTPINKLLTNQNYKDVKELYNKQLKISCI
jgi:hypothetical protein